MQIPSLGRKGPQEEGMATHSSILTWRMPWMEKPSKLQSMGSQSWTPLSDLTTLIRHKYLLIPKFFSENT